MVDDKSATGIVSGYHKGSPRPLIQQHKDSEM